MLVAALLFCPRIHALDPARNILQYNCNTWGRQNGLPSNGIHAIAQTADGYVWLGTQAGLVRFDGITFLHVPLPAAGQFRSESISALAVAPAGGLWFGVFNGGLGWSDPTGHVSTVTNAPGVRQDSNVIHLEVVRDGSLLVASDEGLGRYVVGQPRASTFDVRLPTVRWMHEDANGRLWVVSSSDGVCILKNGVSTRFPDESLNNDQPVAVVVDPDGRIWIGTTTGLRCYDASMHRVEIPAFPYEVKCLLVDRHGVVWIATGGEGLACYKNGAFQFMKKADGLADNIVTGLFEDREGSLWVGTRGGLSQLSDVKFPIYSAPEGLIGGLCHGVAASPRGGLWIGVSQGVSYFDGRTARNFTVSNSGLSYRYIKRIHEARNGDVYLINGRMGIDILSDGHVVASFRGSGWPTALAEDAKGVIVSIAGTLYRVGREGLEQYEFKPGQAPSLTWIRNLHTSRDGSLWVSSVNGLVQVKDSGVQAYEAPSGTAQSDTYDVCEDETGTIWVATAGGLGRARNGKVQFVTERDGLLDNSIYALVPDGLGSLWVNSSEGISRLSEHELNDFLDGKTRHVTTVAFNGLNDVKTVDSTEVEYVGCRTNDGHVWFPTPLGPLEIDPKHVSTDATVPTVRIESVRSNGTAMLPDGPIVVPPGAGELEFDFTALSFVAPQSVRFRYQLQGFERGWVETLNRRQAFYTNLPPGHYVFHVLAANADGVWNEQGDSVPIELRPHVYQTTWFYLLSGGVVMGLAAGGYWRRERRLKLEREAREQNRVMLESEVRVRTADLQRENADRRRAEDALKVSEGFLQSLVQNLPVHVFRKDIEGRITFANRLFCERHGVTPGQVIGRTAFDVLSREHAERQKRTDDEVIATGKPYDAVEEIRDVHGVKAYRRVIKVPVAGADGTIIGIQAMTLDVTELKEAEAKLAVERDLLRTLLDSSPDTIYFKDQQSRFVLVSRSKVQATLERLPDVRQRRVAKGLSADVPYADLLQGLTDFDVYEGEDARAAYEDEQRIIATGEAMIGKLERQVYLDGSQRWHITSKMPWYDPERKILGTFGISKDVTSLKEAEEQLERLNRQLRDTSRQAGMAEVATGVLHNVGNVLNSVNVSATLVADHIRHTKAVNIAKVSAMLKQHATNLAEFLTRDPRGQMIPEYIASLSEIIADEHRAVLTELEQLRKNVEHIKEIVAMQQSYARTSGVSETVSVPDMIEDALRMNAGSLARHDVDTVRDYQARPVITTDKHKVMQILINLVRNAKYACDESGRTDKEITVRATADDRFVRISVIDNGVGIAPENLTRIFAHGFTTRKHGHGFGLHSGALAARELGGALTVHSEGPGKGATFTLELPYKPENPPP